MRQFATLGRVPSSTIPSSHDDPRSRNLDLIRARFPVWTFMKKGVVGKEYFELVRHFPLRPIRSERELDHAIEVIDELIAREDRSRAEDDYLDVLSDLVEKYESEHHPIPDASPVEMLQFLIEERET